MKLKVAFVLMETCSSILFICFLALVVILGDKFLRIGLLHEVCWLMLGLIGMIVSLVALIIVWRMDTDICNKENIANKGAVKGW